ncbi:MAG: tetratricopeptide repeat protein [Bradyrhizobium sp.]|uniref:tetratricopeptide repeat protein n=1 Tax=Bradyrhizobium sp. TaxID=376 RepID=UPI0025C6E47E|nr:tetratricopeptide repeat protein [Bradyrhizobium sp.]MBI5262074.1 tetratricopeptide repeat protein [Bradyrhizobium sp.]
MARTAAGGFWLRAREGARALRRRAQALAAAVVLVAHPAPGLAQVDPVKGEASFSAGGGFARLVLKLAEDVNSEVATAGSILIIRFERPVDIPVDGIPAGAPDYVNSARRDPDGSAIRLSLARKVTVNTMVAGERIFIDLLPEKWSGPPPSLPSEVVRELSERARVAERALRAQRATAETKKRPPIRVRASVQPTFVRFAFDIPDGITVSSSLSDQKLTVAFNAMLNFDLADAKIASPLNVASIGQKIDGDTTVVEIALIGDVDVHSFRDDKAYIVDIAFQSTDRPKAKSPPLTELQPPRTPAVAAPASDKPRQSAPSPSADLVQPTSETIAQQAKIEIKPEQPRQEEPRQEQPKSQPAVEAPKPAPSSAVEAPKPALAETPPQPAEARPPAANGKEPPPAPSEAKAVAEAPAQASGPESIPAVEVKREVEGLRLTFPVPSTVPAALFRRGETVWLVVDSQKPLDVEPIRNRGGAIIAEVSRLTLEKGQAIRIRLNRPLMYSLVADERAGWTIMLADKLQDAPQPLSIFRNVIDPALANVAVSLANPGQSYRLVDPDAGDTLLVITAPPPIRGVIKRQDLVDLSLLESAHGVVVHPNTDDVAVELAPGKVIFGKPGGLTLSPVDVSAERAPTAVRPIFDVEEWRRNQSANFIARENALIGAIAAAEPEQRPQLRSELARFYMARGMYPEAKGVADLMIADSNKDDSIATMLHAITAILIGRPVQGLKDLANPSIGNSYDSELWKALAFARQSKWAEAREKFKNVEFAIAALPLELQRIVTMEAMRASLEVKDYAGAAKRRSELETIGMPPEQKPAFAVLCGRLAEALAHDKDAVDEYKFAVASPDRAAAAEAKQLEIALKQRRNEISQADALRELETLAMIWRGDDVEVKTLQTLARMYADAGRYAESLAAARMATRLQPNSEVSRQAQDAASALFSQLFLGPKGDDIPPVEALGMFYEYRELTPIGRRGDEMIRRLADRLVTIDLLDQAAELLQYQVDHRLEGAARAQVAARLAMVYLANRKPEQAIAALRSTRIGDLSGELRQQRLLLEARAQSDVGRHDLALDIISNVSGREVIRLRSDIYWAARQWRESAEQIELYYGDRWRDFKPLNAVEKGDVIRAAVGYALAEDAIGLARFREKYAPLMSEGADRLAFDVASKPGAASSAEFAEIARLAASVDTLDGFLREMKARFPDANVRGPGKDEPATTGSLPVIKGVRMIKMTR